MRAVADPGCDSKRRSERHGKNRLVAVSDLDLIDMQEFPETNGIRLTERQISRAPRAGKIVRERAERAVNSALRCNTHQHCRQRGRNAPPAMRRILPE
jgi:hypothetical protein